MQRVKKSRTRNRDFNDTDKFNEDNTFHNNSETDGDDNADDEDDINDVGGDYVPLIKGTTEDGDFPKARHIFGFMGFLGFAIVYAMRVNLSVAIVAMVNQSAIPHDAILKIDESCPIEEVRNSSATALPEGQFVWDEAKQGLILGSFFYGYVLTQVPGGRLAELIGGKRVYGYGVLITAIFTLLTPIAAYWDLTLLLIVRILEGMGEGVTYPSMHAMLAHWIPPLERNKFAAIVYAGSNIGTVISMPLTGWLCSLNVLGGWPLTFYIFGLIGVIWFIFWMYFIFDRPRAHPRISHKERDYIERSIKSFQTGFKITDLRNDLEMDLCQPHAESIPWRAIFTSIPVWAILITQCGQSWAFYTLLVDLPTYMSSVLHMDIESNAILNALPFLSAWLVGIVCSIIADWMLEKRYITMLNSYKLWNSISSILPSLGLIGIAYAGCDRYWVTFFLVGLGAFGGAVCAGNQMNHIALSPHFAGTLLGITNGASNFCGFLAPYFVGLIINHHQTLARWAFAFWVAAFFNVAGNFIYLLFASADEQYWSRSTHRSRSGLQSIVHT